MLRGTLLAHTAWIVAIVLHSGHDTRIIQNQRHAPHKTSHLEGRLNAIVAGAFVFNMVLSAISTAMAMISERRLHFA